MRRMSLKYIDTLSDYLEELQHNDEEIRYLLNDLLIGVTSFFRDKDAFSTLENEVIAKLVRNSDPDETLRIWTPGCSSGEEAYTLAILCLHQAEKQGKTINLQVFATDLDEKAIDVGRTAIYPGNIAADVPKEFLKSYFTQEDDHFRINKRVREPIIFAVQNIISDPPFSKIDLIVCRNLMIYLKADIQKKLIAMFHFSLRNDGYLFLGSSESQGTFNHFCTISSKWRIYQKIPLPNNGQPQFPYIFAEGLLYTEKVEETLPAKSELTVGEQAQHTLLSRYAPASVVIDRNFHIHYMHGPLRDFLDFPSGKPTTNLLEMVLPGLGPKLRAIIYQAGHDGETIHALVPNMRRNNENVAVRMTLRHMKKDHAAQMFLITFQEEAAPRKRDTKTGSAPADIATKEDGTESKINRDNSYQQLQYELYYTREDLQSSIEELETSNQELKASNEEAVSMNEELQSVNEELETSREELQSLNEELTTVNNQLQGKIEEVEAINDDLANLLSSTEIATVFLDQDLCIHRFTSIAGELLSIIPSDVGRPISDLAFKVEDKHLVADARRVFEKLTPVEREITSRDDKCFIRRILPYRTDKNRIEGVVVTLTDITSIKKTSKHLEINERQQLFIAELGKYALQANHSVEELQQRTVQGILDNLDVHCSALYEKDNQNNDLIIRNGAGWQSDIVGLRTKAGIESEAGYTMASNDPTVVKELSSETRFRPSKFLNDNDIVSFIGMPIGSQQHVWGTLIACSKKSREFSADDINFLHSVSHILHEAIQHDKNIKRLNQSKSRLDNALDAAAMGIWDYSVADGQLTWNDHHFTIMGYAVDEVTPDYERWRERVHPDDFDRIVKAMESAERTQSIYEQEYRVVHPDGTIRWVMGRGHYQYDENAKSVRMYRCADGYYQQQTF